MQSLSFILNLIRYPNTGTTLPTTLVSTQPKSKTSPRCVETNAKKRNKRKTIGTEESLHASRNAASSIPYDRTAGDLGRRAKISGVARAPSRKTPLFSEPLAWVLSKRDPRGPFPRETAGCPEPCSRFSTLNADVASGLGSLPFTDRRQHQLVIPRRRFPARLEWSASSFFCRDLQHMPRMPLDDAATSRKLSLQPSVSEPPPFRVVGRYRSCERVG